MTYQAKNLPKMPKEIQFSIEHLDRFGQGVFKSNDDNTVYFIPKTLPGEEGKAKIIRRKGKVAFCKLIKITKPSKDRVPSQCNFFDKCQGCTYWMCDYDSEIDFKKENFSRNLRNAFSSDLGIEDAIGSLKFLKDQSRIGYRNRIQLHYSKKQRLIGFSDSQNNIIKIDKCLVASDKINQFLSGILENQQWLGFLRKDDPEKGHFEIYESNEGEVQFSINQDYAFGGFSQVNQKLNDSLVKHIDELILKADLQLEKNDLILDLFGGSGNLTQNFKEQRCLIVDGIKPTKKLKDHQTFHEINLYSARAIDRISEKANVNPKLLILDPPRSGLKNLNDFIEKLKPDYVIYVSCQYDSMIRDFKNAQDHIEKFISFSLCDLFPTTHHVEAITLLKTSH